MKHTPGPWKLESEINDAGSSQFVVTEDYRIICDGYVLGGIRDFQEVHANTKLIAAAPSLLKACQDAILTIEALYNDILESAGKNCDIDSETVYTTDETRQKLNNAIKKATE